MSSLHKKLIIIAVAVLLAASGFGAYQFIYKKNDAYQAVFLDNGQVYFGKINGESKNYLVLKNIYYLQGQSGANQANLFNSADITLVKLGQEAHSPTDEMKISRSHILFIEELKSDSKIVEAIGK